MNMGVNAALLALLSLLLGIAASAIVFLLWLLPRRQVSVIKRELTNDVTGKDRITLELDMLAAETSARTTLAQIVGGFLVLLGLGATAFNLKITYDSAAQSTALSERAQMADRFAKAVPHISDKSIEVRLGGIHELAGVARESKDQLGQHWAAMSLISAFVRERSARSGTLDCKATQNSGPSAKMRCTDIQAALTALATRDYELDPKWAVIDLRGMYAWGAELEGAMLRTARLDDANLNWAKMKRANLAGAKLSGGDFESIDLTDSVLEGSDLSRANFKGATLVGVSMDKQTRLDQTEFAQAKFACAKLSGVDLSAVKGSLTWEQVREAAFDKDTKFPAGVYLDKARSKNERVPCQRESGARP